MKKKLRIMHRNRQKVKQKFEVMRIINYKVEKYKEDEEKRSSRI